MSDRIKALTISLDQDYRDDDVAAIINAIKMVRGVADVSPILATSDDYLARTRVRLELSAALGKFWDEILRSTS